ncbi:MAG TPA: TonB family protein [Bryobacteraceae bacterium]|nr:TonB family protein [Bryobacteraceae bacterium]
MPQYDPLGKYFAGSLGVHAVIVAALAVSGVWNLTKNTWGAEHASTGSVGVTMVKTIPIPQKDAPENPLANDSASTVPQAPEPVKLAPKVKAPEPKAIPIPDKVRKVSPREQSRTAFRPPVADYRPNQVYSKAPQALSSEMYGIQGTNGIDIGPASVLGYQFGAYVSQMSNAIASKWNRSGVHASPAQRAGVTFTIARNGAVSDVKLSSPSGSYDLDISAQRAVHDASPLPPLPREFNKSEATVELWFQLKQ